VFSDVPLFVSQLTVSLSALRIRLTKYSHIHKKRYSNKSLFELQPQLAEAHHQAKIKVKDDFSIVSIVKGMTFVLVELESIEALGMVSLAGQSLMIDGLDADWDKTFVGTYFFVRTGKKDRGTMTLRTRMIEGPLEDPATGSAASDLAAYLSLETGGANKTFEYEIVQGVEMGRRSEVLIEVDMSENGSISEVRLEGGAVQVMKGQVTV
jgi:PhzF family phenazine biosynthesis protein